jgi:ketosteroid isomerase-like protein
MPTNRGRFFSIGLVAMLAACQQAPVDQSAAAAGAIRAADAAWEKAFTTQDTTAALDAVEPNGSMLAPNAPIATGHDAIRAAIGGFYGMPGMTLSWEATKAEAAMSGDLGYSQGTYTLSFNGPNGQPVTDHGKYVTVWRKQADGSWKVVADTFNSDMPAPGM